MKIKLFITFLLIFCLSVPAYSVKISENNGIYHVILKSNKKTLKKLKCIATQDLMTNREIHKKSKAILTINGGFFDPVNKKTVSYVYTDRSLVEDPIFNENLYKSAVVRKNMDKILNRTEFRVLECFDGYKTEISAHKNPVDFECQLVSAVQGGPLIYPQLQLEEEFFILKDDDGNIVRESASVLHRAPRTIVGLEGDKFIHFLIFTDNHPVTLEEAAQYCKELGIDRAMAMDGGGSTSLNYKDSIEVVSTPEKNQGRALKSFIMLAK